MTRFIVGLLIFFSTVAQAQSLNGTWAFRTDPNDVGERQNWYKPETNTATWDSLPVPGNWDLRNEYAHYVGKGWYRRTFTTPLNTANRVVRLIFEGVYHDCTVWLNSQKLGENHMGYLPFEFEITKLLNPTGPNTLVVCADNTFRRGAIWQWGGIRRNVSLDVTEPVRVVRQHITPTVNLTTKTATVAVRVFVQNHMPQPAEATGTVNLSTKRGPTERGPTERGPAPNDFQRSLPFRISVPASGTASVLVQTTLTASETHLWHFDDPFLYSSVVSLAGTSGETTNRFGLRKIELDNQNYRFLLNGESIRPMGFNLVPDDRTTGNTLPTWRIKEDIDMLKALGCNMARLTHLPLPAEALDYLDERGILVFNEIPLWGYDRLADPTQPEPFSWLAQLIANDYNHPSVIGWGVGNEIGYTPTVIPYVQKAVRFVKSLDSTRLAVTVSHTAQLKPDIVDDSDIALINKYGKTLGAVTTLQHQQHPQKILFYSEFGFGQLAEDLDTDFDAKGMLDSLRNRPYLIGASYWTFNDYRSNFFGTKEPSENRPWGIVDVARQKKAAYDSFRREQAPVRGLLVSAPNAGTATVTLQPRQRLDLPAFTLRGYRLVWTTRTADGRVLGGGFVPVPTLAPGDANWQQTIRPQPDPNAFSLHVALLSPQNDNTLDTTLYWKKPQPSVMQSAEGGRTTSGQVRADAGLLRVNIAPNPTAKRHKVRYGLPGTPTLETLPTRNAFVEIPKLAYGKPYQIELIAMNGAGETVSAPQTISVSYDYYTPPIIRYDEPADGGFYVGYATKDDDYLFRLECSETPDDWRNAVVVQTTNPGSLFVGGLQNGKRYYYRLRRMHDAYVLSDWTGVRSLVPDGGQRPATPVLQGVLQTGSEALICFDPVKKATGYRLEYRQDNGPWQSIPINPAQQSFYILGNLSRNASVQCRISTINAYGQSDFSPTLTTQPDAKSRRNR